MTEFSILENPNSKRKKIKRNYTPEDYNKVMKLLNEGKSLNEISKITGIPKSTLSYWKRGIRKPPRAQWKPRPCPELAYVIGCLLSDGYSYERKEEQHYENTLYATDLEYVKHFSRCMAIILGRKENKIQYRERPKRGEKGWIVQYGSAAFHYWWKNKPYKH